MDSCFGLVRPHQHSIARRICHTFDHRPTPFTPEENPKVALNPSSIHIHMEAVAGTVQRSRQGDVNPLN